MSTASKSADAIPGKMYMTEQEEPRLHISTTDTSSVNTHAPSRLLLNLAYQAHGLKHAYVSPTSIIKKQVEEYFAS